VVVQALQDALEEPAKTPDASDFSAARFDPALETSPELRRLFTNVNNMGLKRAGANSLYVRGSRSRSALKSIPVSFLVFDEVEEMEDEAIALGRERTSGQMDFQLWEISTPSVPGAGINALFERSRQEHFFFPCPSCRRHIQLTYPDCLVITGEYESDPKIKDSHLICPSCKAKLPHEEKPQYLAAGKWVSAHPDRDIRGFHVSQLYSCALHPSELAKAARRAEVSATYEQEFYNSKLGLPHIVAGSNVTIKDVNSCVWDYRMNEQSYISGENFLTLGIDVGTRCHFELTSWRFSTVADTIDVNEEAFGHVVFAGTFTDFREADTLIRKYRPRMTVIDNLPDTRASKVLAARFPRLVKLCSYSAASARDLVDHGEHVTVDRTTWLDLALGRFNAKRISLPQDIPHEYKQHMTSLVRIYRQHRTTGENIAMYKKTDDDHYAHARNYNEIALRLALASYGAPVAIEGRTF